MARNTVYRIEGPDPEAKRRQEREEIARYGRVQTEAERAENNRLAAVRAENDARIEAERRDYLRKQLFMSGEAARARLMSDLHPLRLAAEFYAGEQVVAGAARVLRAATSATMRPGFVRIARGGSPNAAREAAALRHGQVVASREAAASRAAQFKEIKRASKAVGQEAAKGYTARAVERAYEYAPEYPFGETPTVYDPSITPLIEEAAADLAREGVETVGKEAAREFANRAMGRAAASAAEAIPARAAQVAERFAPGTYSRALGGPGVDWARTFYAGLARRTADAVKTGVAKLKNTPVKELAGKALVGTAKYASVPRMLHFAGTKMPIVNWVVDRTLPTLNPMVRESMLNTLTGVQDLGLAVAWMYGKYREASERGAVEESKQKDKDLGYERAGYENYRTNVVYGTGMKENDIDAASWRNAAVSLLRDRDRALQYINGKGGVLVPGTSNGAAAVARMFDARLDELARLPAAKTFKDNNRRVLFRNRAGGVGSYDDAVVLAADPEADPAARERARAAVEATNAEFDSMSPTEQVLGGMSPADYARRFLKK